MPTCRHGLAERLGHEAEGIHVRGLALVRRHAGGGVALDVLDRLEALAHGEADVLGRHVVLQVDEGAPAPPCRRRSAACAPAGKPVLDALAGEPARSRRPAAAAPALQPSAEARGRAGRSRWQRRPSARPAPRRPVRRHRCAASKPSLPRDCENRWTAGVQPPERPTQSHGRVRRAPTFPGSPIGATIKPLTRPRPREPTTVCPASTSQPAARNAAASTRAIVVADVRRRPRRRSPRP